MTRTPKPNLTDELGINEPYVNPTMAGATFRHNGKMYRYNENEEIVRFYPPDEKQVKTKGLSPLSDDKLGINEPYLNPKPDPTTIMVRFEGRYYKFDADGNPYRFYPPSLRKPRTKTETNL